MAFNYSVSLQIRHPDFNPEIICAGLNKKAKRSWMVGQPRSTPKGISLAGTYQESYCVFDFGGGDDGELADCLRAAVKQLESSASLLNEIRSSGGKSAFYVSWTVGERGEVFDVQLLENIARLGIDLGIEPLALS